MTTFTHNTLACSLGQTGPAQTGQEMPRSVMGGSIVAASVAFASKKLGKAKGPQAPTLPCWRG